VSYTNARSKGDAVRKGIGESFNHVASPSLSKGKERHLRSTKASFILSIQRHGGPANERTHVGRGLLLLLGRNSGGKENAGADALGRVDIDPPFTPWGLHIGNKNLGESHTKRGRGGMRVKILR